MKYLVSIPILAEVEVDVEAANKADAYKKAYILFLEGQGKIRSKEFNKIAHPKVQLNESPSDSSKL